MYQRERGDNQVIVCSHDINPTQEDNAMIRISHIIAHLLELADEHGDLPVFASDEDAQLSVFSLDRVEPTYVSVEGDPREGQYPAILVHSM
jgi:hypothetical protein